MKLVNHGAKIFPTVATGSLVGMESLTQPGLLEVTSCFPFPNIDVPASDDHRDDHRNNHNHKDQSAAAPRAKANVAYQTEMIKFLREVNVDANNVGWYTSTSMGNFINLNTIENQFFYQKDPNEKAIALVHDVSRSSQGSLSLRAYRLSPAFVAAYKEAKFTTDKYKGTLPCSRV
jgi:translation initiation factor 3 subunit H